MTADTDTDATGSTDSRPPAGAADGSGDDSSDRAGTVPDGDGGDGEAARHAARAALYGAVGGAFCYPDEDLLADLTARDARESVLEAAQRLGLCEPTREFIDALAAADVEALESAYNGLFGVPDGGEYPVVPYEAHYTTGSEVSEEQRRIATVVGLMETFGVEPSDDFAERQDHVAAELELMQVVAAQRAVACHRGDAEGAGNLAEAEETILDTHLVPFVPALAHDLRRTEADADGTGRAVYEAAVTLAERLVRADHRAHREDATVAEVSHDD